MRIRLMSRNEFEKVEIGGTTFWARKLTGGASDEITLRHASNGKVDHVAIAKDRWSHILSSDGRPADKPGWAGLLDGDKELAYDQSKVEYVLSGLSESVRTLLLAAATTQAHEEEEPSGA